MEGKSMTMGASKTKAIFTVLDATEDTKKNEQQEGTVYAFTYLRMP
jgi:hypothetical protein